MSGDVQPRKRRDKKKKKDEVEESAAPPLPARARSLTPLENDDVNIHVHKEGGTGGGICAKLVFFILLSALAVLIGLIITEHRGLTDLDTIERESRFTQYFEGWVDTAPEEHDDHHGVAVHDDEHDDHDEHDEHDDHDDHDEEEHDEHEEEEEEDHDHDEEEEEEEVAASEEEEQEDEEEDEVEESVQEGTEEEDEVEESVQEGTEEEDEDEEEEEEMDEGTEEADEEEEPSVQNDDDDEEDEVDQKSEEADEADNDNLSEAPKTEEDQGDDDDDEDIAQGSPEQDGDDAVASKEDAADEEDVKSQENEAEDDQQEDAVEGEEGEVEEQPISVVKAAVGLVILVVAYVVLIKKWKSDEAAGAEEVQVKTQAQQDLARRNTIVVPPKVEEVELNYDDYSDGEDEESYDDEEEEEEYEIRFDPQVKKDYQKLRNTYERSLTPDSDRFDREDEEPEDEDEDEELEPEEEELEPEEELQVGVIEGEEEYGDDEEPEGEGEAEEEEPLSEEDDEELMKKLEEKYGKLSGPQPTGEEVYEEDIQYEDEEQDPEEEEDDEDDGFPWTQGGAQEAAVPEEESWKSAPSYDHENITNDNDFAIFDQLDEAQENLNVNAALALSKFAAILKLYPSSPRAIYGRARALDQLAEQRQSNQLLTEAITNYQKLMSLDAEVPPVLFNMAADRCINRLRFMGQYSKAIEIHRLVINRFPDEVAYRNQLAVTYLTTNRMEDARRELKLSLERWPTDGFALVHYGFLLKVHDGHLEPAVKYLQRGIATRQDGVIDGRFYFHLGDALARLGRHDEAMSIYKDGAEQKVFLSPTQRSLYNVPTLKGQPWWRHEDTPLSYRTFFKQLERNFKSIREEGLAVMKSRGLFQDEAENLKDKGDWKQFELFARGVKHKKHCERCPLTCKLVEAMKDAAGCRRGQVKFSVMLPGTHVWPHCGPTNCRLRAHLGLKVPEKTFIRVGHEIRSWKEGEVMIFDDSFEHEVWHNGSDFRLVLIVDVWHPELTAVERRSLPAI